MNVDRIDLAEAFLVHRGAKMAGLGESPDCVRVVHRFTPGLYIRECHMLAGHMVISKIHKTEHPFVISQGRCSVYSENGGVEHLSAPHTGITQPGTRRVIAVHEDTIWTTFHPTEKTDPVEIERDIIEPHENPVLAGLKELT